MLAVFGCAPARPADDASRSTDQVDLAPSELVERGATGSGAGAESPARAATARPAVPGTGPEPTAVGALVLSRSALIRAVLARNPGIAARRDALRAARARSSQVSALDDPEVAYSFAPMSIGSTTFGQTIEVSQRFPWPGKRSSLGDSADFEADAAKEEVRVTELDLALEASLLFDDRWLVDRKLDVNQSHRQLLSQIKSSAESQLSVGRGSLQDPLQAEVEISRLEQEETVLRSQRHAIVANLNGLLHRAPDATLPPPPKTSSVALDAPPPEALLLRQALYASPELGGLRARTRAAEALARYAAREYYPDVTLMASYSTMFMPDSRLMVGASAPIPLQRGRRAGAADEADARIAEARSESMRVVDRIRAETSALRQQVVESIRVVKIIDGRLLPAVRAQVAAARVDFLVGRTSFLSVVEAERSLRDIELSRWTALAELGKRRARLDRALGRVPFGAERSGGR